MGTSANYEYQHLHMRDRLLFSDLGQCDIRIGQCELSVLSLQYSNTGGSVLQYWHVSTVPFVNLFSTARATANLFMNFYHLNVG